MKHKTKASFIRRSQSFDEWCSSSANEANHLTNVAHHCQAKPNAQHECFDYQARNFIS